MMWAIYFLGVLDDIKLILVICALVGGVFLVTVGIYLFCIVISGDAGDEAQKVMAFLRKLAVPVLVMCILCASIPNSKTVAAMYVVPAIVNNEQIQGITGNSLKALEKLTQKWLKDLAEEGEHI